MNGCVLSIEYSVDDGCGYEKVCNGYQTIGNGNKTIAIPINISISSVCLRNKNAFDQDTYNSSVHKILCQNHYFLCFCFVSFLPTKHARTHELSRQMTARARHFLFLSSWRCFCSYYHFLIAGGNKTNPLLCSVPHFDIYVTLPAP